MNKATKVLMSAVMLVFALTTMVSAQTLFFSEYVEGSSNNKALEIYNPTGAEVDLSNYRLYRANNGSAEWQDTLDLSGSLAADGIYIIANPSADATILDLADTTHTITFYNGDDAIALTRNDAGTWTTIDVIGELGVDPGSSWDVAGVTEATNEQTLIRKEAITTGQTVWATSAGTNADDSEWIVNDRDDFSNLGLRNPVAAGPDTVDVTFTLNFSTLQDTVTAGSYSVYINGAIKGAGAGQAFAGGETISWDANATAELTNIGGDYWQGTYQMVAGDTLLYKYRYRNNVTEASDDENGFDTSVNPAGWDTRGVVITEDTVLPVNYYNDRTDNPTPGADAPFASAEDSITVYFRVNVGGQVQTGDFDPATDKIGIRGNPVFFDNPGDWGASAFYLDSLGGFGDNLFYGGFAKIQKDSAANITDPVTYKFVIESGAGAVTWENDPNNEFNMPKADSTTYWRFFNDVPPTSATIIDTELNFSVNVGILEGIGFFNSSIDTVFARGTFNSWGTNNQMNFNNDSGNYDALNIPLRGAVDSEVLYKYYIKWDQRRDEEASEFYLSGITHDGSGWEEPGVTGGADRTLILVDEASQPVQSQFYNGVEPQALMIPSNVDGGAITVTFKIDMTPAVANTAQPFIPATDSVFLFVDTPFFALTNGITVPGDDGGTFVTQSVEERDRVRFTDDDGDMIYELDLPLQLPTLNHIGFRIAYGEPTTQDGSLYVNGGGFAAGRRHYQYVQPIVAPDGDDIDELPDVSWPATYTMETLTWQDGTDLPWETPPDYSKVNVSNEIDNDVVTVYSLEQNYPNPFNPSTNIRFNLPNAANVKLTVYNVLGQQVASLINGKTMTSGSHTVEFDASSLSSGMYIYRLEAGSFTSTKRMMLIK
jgi:hypothetical protein